MQDLKGRPKWHFPEEHARYILTALGLAQCSVCGQSYFKITHLIPLCGGVIGIGSNSKNKVKKREKCVISLYSLARGNCGYPCGCKKFLFSKSAQCCAVSLTPTYLLVSRLKMSRRKNIVHCKYQR